MDNQSEFNCRSDLAADSGYIVWQRWILTVTRRLRTCGVLTSRGLGRRRRRSVVGRGAVLTWHRYTNKVFLKPNLGYLEHLNNNTSSKLSALTNGDSDS
jgi:hypothetical protein